MEDDTAIALFAVVALILCAGALILSLQVSNPLFRSATHRLPAIVVLTAVALVVGLAVALGIRNRRVESPYW